MPLFKDSHLASCVIESFHNLLLPILTSIVAEKTLEEDKQAGLFTQDEIHIQVIILLSSLISGHTVDYVKAEFYPVTLGLIERETFILFSNRKSSISQDYNFVHLTSWQQFDSIKIFQRHKCKMQAPRHRNKEEQSDLTCRAHIVQRSHPVEAFTRLGGQKKLFF